MLNLNYISQNQPAIQMDNHAANGIDFNVWYAIEKSNNIGLS